MITIYLSDADVIAIHDLQIDVFGGASGLRDPGQLDAAVFRPQSGYYDDLYAEAAALWESLSQNHPFVDGNKRTAQVSTYVFMKLNGLQISATDAQMLAFAVSQYEGDGFTYEAALAWLRANTTTL